MEKITKENLYTGFRVLFNYLSRYKKAIAMLSLLGIVSAIGNGAVPYIIGKFFDAITNTATIEIFGISIYFYLALLIAWVAIQLVTSFVDWIISITSEFLSNTIWLDYISKGFSFLLELPLAFHKQNKVGEVANKINIAGNALESIAGRIVINLAPQFLSIIIALFIAFYINPLLSLILIIGLSIYVIMLAYSVQPLGRLHKDYYETVSKGFGDAYDAIGNVTAIKQASAEHYERGKLANVMLGAVPKWMRIQKIWSNLSLYQRVTILGTQLAIFVLSIAYVQNGTITIGELLAFNSYAAMIFGPFVTIAVNWQIIHGGIINIQETEKILELPTENYEPAGALSIDLKGDISFKNVSFKYEEGKDVLNDISFDVKAGETVALVGESGVGKSTLIDLISGYHFPTSGEVHIDGHPIQNIHLRRLRMQIAIVPQEVVLFNDTIDVNVKYGRFDASREEIEGAARKAHALEFIEKFPNKWNQLVGERGVKLSVGQKQRVAIARAILRNPRILVLDEPTSALDAGSEKIIVESLDDLMKGRTTFIIAHRLSTVRKADKILVFKNGRLIEIGTHDTLLAQDGGEYRRLYELQIGLHG
jgi:ABC-type multidrug transport system fused ATPase/permease subunit